MRSHGGPGGGRSSELRKAGIIDWAPKGEWDEGEETRDTVTGDYFVATQDFNGLDTFALEFAAGFWLQIAGPSAVAVEVNDTVFVDAAYGNDGLGAREDMSKAFATIEAAVAAAVAGDTIHVWPGTYAPVSNLATKQLDFHFATGAVVNATIIIFDISTDIPITVTGHGVFTSSLQVVRLAALTGSIVFEGDRITSTGNSTLEFTQGAFRVEIPNILNSDPSTGNALLCNGGAQGEVIADNISKSTDGGHTIQFIGWTAGLVQLFINNIYSPTGALNFAAIKTDSTNGAATSLEVYGKIRDTRTAMTAAATDANAVVWHEAGDLEIVGDITTALYRGIVTATVTGGSLLHRGHITSNHIDESVYVGSGTKEVRIYGDVINTNASGSGTGYVISIGRTTVTATVKLGNKLFHKGVCHHQGVGTEDGYFKGGVAPSDTILVLDGGKIIAPSESVVPEPATTQDVKITGFVTSNVPNNASINPQISSILVDALVE